MKFTPEELNTLSEVHLIVAGLRAGTDGTVSSVDELTNEILNNSYKTLLLAILDIPDLLAFTRVGVQMRLIKEGEADSLDKSDCQIAKEVTARFIFSCFHFTKCAPEIAAKMKLPLSDDEKRSLVLEESFYVANEIFDEELRNKLKAVMLKLTEGGLDA